MLEFAHIWVIISDLGPYFGDYRALWAHICVILEDLGALPPPSLHFILSNLM